MPYNCSLAFFCSPIASETRITTAAVPITTPIAVSATRALRRLRFPRISRTKSKSFILRGGYPFPVPGLGIGVLRFQELYRGYCRREARYPGQTNPGQNAILFEMCFPPFGLEHLLHPHLPDWDQGSARACLPSLRFQVYELQCEPD